MFDHDDIIAAVLEACTGQAYKLSAILEHEQILPLVSAYGTARVTSVVRALAIVGWLFCRGRTNSALYQTTAAGRARLAELRAGVR